MSIIATIEAKLAEVASQIKTHSGYLTDIESAISKLSTDKSTSTANVSILNGAHQAYTDVLNVLKAAEANPIGAAVISSVESTSVGQEIESAAQAVESIAPIVETAVSIAGELV